MTQPDVLQMLGWLEQHYGYDASYARAIHAASPDAFHTFMEATKLSRHREVVPADAAYTAKLVGTLVEDCGPCTQLVVNMAREEGMNDVQIEAVLRADVAAMSEDVARAFRFATAVATRARTEDDAREAVRARWGDKGVVDLTFALQGSRLYPMVKAGLGFAHECRRVRVGTRPVDVRRAA